jgi:hypothetical protein
METLLATPRSADGSEYKPADFYAGATPLPSREQKVVFLREASIQIKGNDYKKRRWTDAGSNSGGLCGTQ